MSGKARAFDDRWYPVEVVLVGPRSARVVSIAGEVGRDVPVVLTCRLPAGDSSADALVDLLHRAGYKNVCADVKTIEVHQGRPPADQLAADNSYEDPEKGR